MLSRSAGRTVYGPWRGRDYTQRTALSQLEVSCALVEK
jgi:hypothetical protein